MNQCKECRYWEPPRALQDYERTWPRRDLIVTYGACKATEAHDGEPVMSITRAWAADLESYRAILRTTADFSCNQFEAKDEK